MPLVAAMPALLVHDPAELQALDGQTLYGIHVDAEPVLRFALAEDFLEGEPRPLAMRPALLAPTTAALARGDLLIVNSQFDKLFYGGEPDPRFTLTRVPIE